MALGLGITYANGMLYAVLYEGHQIAVMDVEGNTRSSLCPFRRAMSSGSVLIMLASPKVVCI
jgi:hypothetical protein